MNTNRKAEIISCDECNGKGITPQGTQCLGCQGAGVIGSDGIHEYFLSLDKDGKPIVTGVKEQNQSVNQHPSNTSSPPPINKKNIFSLFLIILVIVLYLGYTALHLTLIKNSSIFWMITIIFIGTLTLTILANSKIFNKVSKTIIGQFINTPRDLIYYIENKRKE